MPIVVFFVYVNYGNDLTYTKQFTVLSLFVVLVLPIQQVSGFVTQLNYAKVGLDRLQEFFEQEEFKGYINLDESTNKLLVNEENKDGSIIVFKNAHFGWLLEEDKKRL